MSWEKVTGFAPLWSPMVNEEVDAILESMRETEFGNQFSLRLVIPQEISVAGENGEKEIRQFAKADIVCTPSHKMLNNILEQIVLGTRVKIKVVGVQPSKTKGKNDMMVYSVNKWKD
jgi:hypothetical protein